MKTSKLAFAAIAVVALGLSGAVQARDHGRGDGRSHERATTEPVAMPRHFDSRIDRRQERQRTRIRDGRHDGDLTSKELRRLRKDQRKMARLERRFEADDHFNRRERRILDELLDRSGRRIARAKRNDSNPHRVHDWDLGHPRHHLWYGHHGHRYW